MVLKPKALVFDLDGTLINSEVPEFEAWRNIYAQHGVVLPLEVWGAGVGTWGAFDPQAHLEELLGRGLDWDALLAGHREALQATIGQTSPLPGAQKVLDWAQGRFGLALASSSGRVWVQGWLERLGWSRVFATVKTRDDVARFKPAPDLYVAAAHGLGLNVGDCLAVEDSPNGAAAAVAAGMPVVVVPNMVTRVLAFPKEAVVLDSLEDVMGL